MHYWDVWHGNTPFTEFRKFKFRYLSEFGFQAFPCLKTVETFTAPKHFAFEDPKLSYSRDGNTLVISAQAYAKNVEIEGVDGNVRLSDNFYDMNPGPKRIEIVEGDAGEFRLRSVYDIR